MRTENVQVFFFVLWFNWSLKYFPCNRWTALTVRWKSVEQHDMINWGEWYAVVSPTVMNRVCYEAKMFGGVFEAIKTLLNGEVFVAGPSNIANSTYNRNIFEFIFYNWNNQTSELTNGNLTHFMTSLSFKLNCVLFVLLELKLSKFSKTKMIPVVGEMSMCGECEFVTETLAFINCSENKCWRFLWKISVSFFMLLLEKSR